MKTTMTSLLLCMLIFSLIAARCLTTGGEDRLQKAIPGTYIRYSQHEFGREWDTLTIQKSNSDLTVFQILRKWNYERIMDGHKIQPEYKRQSSSGIYDEEEHVLKDTETGDVYTFDLAKHTVSTGETIYKKIK